MIDKIRNIISQLLVKLKKNWHMLKQIFFFLAMVFLVSGCNNPNKEQTQFKITSAERAWMEKFFNDLVFVEGGCYTLWGSKPITEIVLYHYTDDEMIAMTQGLSKEELKNCYVNDHYDLPENWEKWEQIQSRFPIEKYLLFRSHFDDDKKASFVYLVDILKTAVLIESNYELFKHATGSDFHPLEVVFDIQNQKSVFWQKVRESKESPLLWGLLFGYGKMNSLAFYWKYFDCPQSCQKYMETYPSHYSNPSPQGRVYISVNNFTIPQFISFSNNDEMVLRYVQERKKIQDTCQRSNCLQAILEQLTSN